MWCGVVWIVSVVFADVWLWSSPHVLHIHHSSEQSIAGDESTQRRHSSRPHAMRATPQRLLPYGRAAVNPVVVVIVQSTVKSQDEGRGNESC